MCKSTPTHASLWMFMGVHVYIYTQLLDPFEDMGKQNNSQSPIMIKYGHQCFSPRQARLQGHIGGLGAPIRAPRALHLCSRGPPRAAQERTSFLDTAPRFQFQTPLRRPRRACELRSLHFLALLELQYFSSQYKRQGGHCILRTLFSFTVSQT